jgi:hypothetical protein
MGNLIENSVDTFLVGAFRLESIESIQLLLGFNESVMAYCLAFGIAGLVGGLALLSAHKAALDQAMATENNERVQRFEIRKFRRRATASSMIASVGCMMAALFWVDDPKVFSIFIMLILTLLLLILTIAFFDMFSVGLQSLTRTDDAAREALVEEYLRQRKKTAFEDQDEK